MFCGFICRFSTKKDGLNPQNVLDRYKVWSRIMARCIVMPECYDNEGTGA